MCNVPTVTNKRKPLQTEYKLDGHTLSKLTSARDFGVTITDNLKWDNHINSISDKASRTPGFLRRNLNIGSTAIKQQANFTLVRPLVEYASSVWDPYTQGNIQKIEMVQWWAARYVTNRHRNTSSVSDMLQALNWRTLPDRLCMLYMIDRELVAIKKDRRLIPPRKRTRQDHSRTFQTIIARQTKERCLSSQGQCEMECLTTGHTRSGFTLCLQGQGICLVMSQGMYCF